MVVGGAAMLVSVLQGHRHHHMHSGDPFLVLDRLDSHLVD